MKKTTINLSTELTELMEELLLMINLIKRLRYFQLLLLALNCLFGSLKLLLQEVIEFLDYRNQVPVKE